MLDDDVGILFYGDFWEVKLVRERFFFFVIIREDDFMVGEVRIVVFWRRFKKRK